MLAGEASGRVPAASQLEALERAEAQLGGAPPGFGKQPPAMHQPGGRLLLDIQHPAFKTVERLQRNLPEEGFFNESVSPSSPFQWTILAYHVPEGQQFWLTDYSFAVGRPSGVDAGDILYAAEGRFSGVMGFDVVINDMFRVNDLEYGLDPAPIPAGGSEFRSPNPAGSDIVPDATPDQFDIAASNSFAATAGPGTSLLPVRSDVQGPRQGPFTMIVNEGDFVALRAVIFRPVRSPISFIEGRLAGFTLHTNASKALLERMRPH